MSLAVERGEVFGLLGPNGAGKTTTLRVLTTLLQARRAGRGAWSRATTCASDALAVRASIGYVPQALSADGALTAAENLDFYARVTGVPAARAARADRRGGRGDGARADARPARARRSPAACCGGWRSPRRCSTGPRCCSSTSRPSGLDPTARRLVWERLHALRERGRHDDRRHHAPDGGGRAPLRPPGDHGPRPPRRAGRARRAAARATACASLEEVFTAVTGHAIDGRGGRLQRCPRPAPRRPPARLSARASRPPR